MQRRSLVITLTCVLASCSWSVRRAPPLSGDWLSAPPDAPKEPAKQLDKYFDIAITPHQSEIGIVDAVDIGLEIAGIAPDGQPLELWLSEEHEGEPGWPAAIGDLASHDGAGILRFEKRSVTQDGSASVVWRSDRAPSGTTQIAYQVRVPKADAQAVTGLREHAGGFQGIGSTFLLLPDGEVSAPTRLTWNLAGLAQGAEAISSFGLGNAETSGDLGRVSNAMFMAGALGRVTIDHEDVHFRGAWLGRPAFDPAGAIAWAAQVRDVERAFFHDASPTLFSFLIRKAPLVGFGARERQGTSLKANKQPDVIGR